VSGISLTSSHLKQTMKSIESLNFSKMSLDNSGSKSKMESVVSSPRRKKIKNEDSEFIGNKNSLTLRKGGTSNPNSLSMNWIDLNQNHTRINNSSKDKGDISCYNMFLTNQIKNMPQEKKRDP